MKPNHTNYQDNKGTSSSNRCDNALECYQLPKGTCTTTEVRMCVKSTRVSNSECLDNVLKRYQVAKETYTKLEVRICINDNSLVYKIYILVKCAIMFAVQASDI